MSASKKEEQSIDFDLSQTTQSLSHKQALEVASKYLRELIEDPLLSDITVDVTSDEIKEKVDFEKGKAFQIQLKRPSENGFDIISIIVKQSTTVSQLKQKIERTLKRKIKEDGGTTCLSWRYFWRTYWLVHNNEKLSEEMKTMNDYGLKDGSEITFIKRLRRT